MDHGPKGGRVINKDRNTRDSQENRLQTRHRLAPSLAAISRLDNAPTIQPLRSTSPLGREADRDCDKQASHMPQAPVDWARRVSSMASQCAHEVSRTWKPVTDDHGRFAIIIDADAGNRLLLQASVDGVTIRAIVTPKQLHIIHGELLAACRRPRLSPAHFVRWGPSLWRRAVSALAPEAE
jgi:hypothetical protein